MPSWIHGRSHVRGAFLACLVAGLATACATQPPRDRTLLPEAFTDPARFPDFTSTAARSSLESRIRRSKCANANSDAPSAFGGLSTRPEMSSGVVLDTGHTPDGTKWFIHRAADDREMTYCGVAMVGVGTGTNVSVTSVRLRDIETIKAALESGDFFCKCEQLAK